MGLVRLVEGGAAVRRFIFLAGHVASDYSKAASMQTAAAIAAKKKKASERLAQPKVGLAEVYKVLRPRAAPTVQHLRMADGTL
eukprot:14357732-Alexandrium_andersonii.AAC.1